MFLEDVVSPVHHNDDVCLWHPAEAKVAVDALHLDFVDQQLRRAQFVEGVWAFRYKIGVRSAAPANPATAHFWLRRPYLIRTSSHAAS